MEEINIHSIIRSRRRSISLVVTPEAKLIIRAPHRVPERYLQHLVVRKAAWITKKITQAKRYGAVSMPTKAQERVQFLTYQNQAQKLITSRVEHYSQQTGWRYAEVKITNTRSRWASCSPTGVLRFSWRLVHAPLDVIDYVVVHELAHIKHKNHSRVFWSAVAEIIPDYAQKRKWLRENKIFWNRQNHF